MQIVERCDTAVGLFIARDPSTPDLRAVEIKHGADIAELIAHALNVGALEPDDLPDLRVYIDGKAIPFATYEERADSLDIIPPAGSAVNLQVEPTGGSNGSARLALTIVLTAVAVVSAFTVGAFTASLWQLGAAIVPQLVFPIQTPDRLASPNDQGGLNASANTIRRRGQMPLMLGSGRVPLDVAAQAYSVNLNGETWLHVIFGAHYGPCDLTDVKIGETLLADYPASDIQVEYKLTPGPREFSFYNQSVNQENLQDELDLGGAAEVHTTAEACERVEIDLTWPQGLQFRKTSGSIVQQETRIKVEWAPVGSESYTAAPLEGGPYRDRLGNALPTGTIDVIARTQDPVRRTLAWDKGNADQIKIRVSAWDPDNDDPTMATQAVYWTALRSIVKKQPIADRYLSCMAMRIKSSDDLGGTLPTVTAVVTPHAPVYHAGSHSWDDDIESWAPTDNVAAHVRMLLLGPGAAKPADPSEWGDSFGEMYELIEERGWKGGYMLASEASQRDALKILGAIGRFSAYDAGDGLVLVPDWVKAAPRQLFTGRNVQQFTYTRDFKSPCHAVVVEFLNIDEDGKQDEVVVYNTGYTAETATLLETIRFDWQMTGQRATREGLVFLAKRNIQVEAFEWTAGPSAIASSYGSRVRIRHYSSLYGSGEGRVLYRHMAGGLVTGVRLDDEVEMEAGQTYALDVQRYDKLLAGIAVVTSPGRTRDLMFPSPLPVEDAPLAGDQVAFGKVNVVTEDVEIIDFAPSGDQVRISARKYIGPELFLAETGEIPDFETGLTPTAKAPKPRLIGINQASPEGVKIAFDVDEPRGGLIESFPIRWRRATSGVDANPWNVITPAAANARVAVTPPFPDAASVAKDPESVYKVDVEIRTKLRSGDLSTPLIVPDIEISRTIPAPVNFTAAGIKRTSADGSSYPVLAVSCEPLTSGLEQDLIVEKRPAGGSPTEWVSAGHPLPAANPTADFTGVTGGQLLDVRAQWRTTDNYSSAWVVLEDILIPLNALVSAGVATIGGLTPQQVTDELRAATEAGKALSKAMLELALGAIEERGQLISETFHKGVRVKRILIDDDQEWEEGDKTFWSRMNLIAVLSDDGNSMIMSQDTLMWSPTESLADHVEAVRTQIGTDIAAFNTSIRTWVNSSSAAASWISTLEVAYGGNFQGVFAQTATISSRVGGKYTLAFNINGHVSGLYLANTGATSSFIVSASEIGFSNGSSTLFPLAIVGGVVKATNFEADRIRANSIVAESIIGGEITDSVASVSGATIGLSVGSWETLRSLSYFSRGGRLEVYTQSTTLSYSTDSYVSYRVIIDGVVQDDWPNYIKGGAYDRSVSITNATPSAGWHTIEFQAMLLSGSGAAASVNQSVFVTEHKTET